MNRFFAAVASTVLAAAFSANAQLNLLPSQITFRTPATSQNATYHYGDFSAVGGNSGSSWGWLHGTQLRVWGFALVQGDLSVTGAKNFVQPHPMDTTKAIRYTAVEAGEVLTMARGTARTSGGIVKVDLPEDFALVTSDKAPLTVLLTVDGVPALAFVKSKSKEGLTVQLKDSDLHEFGDVDLSYQVTGVRVGFEDRKTIISIEELAFPVESEMEKEAPANKKRKEFGDRIHKAGVAAKAKAKK